MRLEICRIAFYYDPLLCLNHINSKGQDNREIINRKHFRCIIHVTTHEAGQKHSELKSRSDSKAANM